MFKHTKQQYLDCLLFEFLVISQLSFNLFILKGRNFRIGVQLGRRATHVEVSVVKQRIYVASG